MSKKAKLFQYAILWHPTDKQIKDENAKSKVLVDLQTILAVEEKSVLMTASMAIPAEYKDQLEQVDLVIRPF